MKKLLKALLFLPLIPSTAWASDNEPFEPEPKDETHEEDPPEPPLVLPSQRYAVFAEQGVFSGKAERTEYQDWSALPTRTLLTKGQGTAVGIQVPVAPEMRLSFQGAFGTAYGNGRTEAGGTSTREGFSGTNLAKTAQISVTLDGKFTGVTLGAGGGNPFGTSDIELRPLFRVHFGAVHRGWPDLTPTRKGRHGGFFAYGPRRVGEIAYGTSVAAGWIFHWASNELELAGAAQMVRGITSFGIEATLTPSFPVGSGITVEAPFGFSFCPLLAFKSGYSYQGFASLRVRVGR